MHGIKKTGFKPAPVLNKLISRKILKTESMFELIILFRII
jgi:hypothetical protein